MVTSPERFFSAVAGGKDVEGERREMAKERQERNKQSLTEAMRPHSSATGKNKTAWTKM